MNGADLQLLTSQDAEIICIKTNLTTDVSS